MHKEGISGFAEVKEREHLSLLFTYSWKDLIQDTSELCLVGACCTVQLCLWQEGCMCSVQGVKHETEEDEKPFLSGKTDVLIFDDF